MASFNKVILIGNLTKDPELRYTPQGTAVVNLRLAVNTRFRDKAQELREETCFVTAVVWNKQAETCNQYLHKGSPVMVEGRLQSRSWEDNSGQKRSVMEVRADRVQFLGGAPGKGAAEPSQEQLPEPSTEATWLEDQPAPVRQESEEKANEN
ncbi:MAG: single-stranded DNA-binding protein [Candidatus Omnitrophota bacterium]